MNNAIRDYLYLDVDRVRSIYAQASGGLTESVRELQQEFDSFLAEQEADSETLRKSILLGSGRVATRILHDYLFSTVEEKLGDTIVHVSAANICDIRAGTLFRVTGIPEIDDIARMLTIMDNYNDMYKYLLTVGHASEVQNQIYDVEDVLSSLEENLKRNSARDLQRKKKEAEKLLAQLEPENITARLLRENRSGISPIISETFKRVYGLLYNEIFEIKIVCEFDKSKLFRAILNREYLREEPSIIYAKYGSRPSVTWTMVGQVTTTKMPANPQEEATSIAAELETNESSNEDDPNLRDAFENLYEMIAKVEGYLIGPGSRATWIATPLAIYHETS